LVTYSCDEEREMLQERVAKLRRSGLTFSQIGEALGITKDRARGIYTTMPVVPEMRGARELVLAGDVVVTGDVHVPYTDLGVAAVLAQCARENGIRQLAIVGDMFSFPNFGKWPTIVREPTAAEELKFARGLLELWNDAFDKIYLCMGNHDLRLISRVQGELEVDNLADLFRPAGMRPDRLEVTMRDRIWWGKGGSRWLLAHQVQYSRNKLTVASALERKYRCNVLTHHQHHQSLGVTEDGQHIIADNGCLCVQSKTPYTALSTNSMPVWDVGFSFFKDGKYNFYWHGQPTGWKPGKVPPKTAAIPKPAAPPAKKAGKKGVGAKHPHR